jgi:GTP cyclohydrolase I
MYDKIVAYLKDECSLTDAERSNFEDTTERAAKALMEMVIPSSVLLAELGKVLSKNFALGQGEAVSFKTNLTQPNIKSNSLCPHHLLPITYNVAIAVVYGHSESKVVGLSKYVRATQLLAKRAVIQEQYTRDLVTLFTKGIISNTVSVGTDVRVSGAMAIVEGVHGCMRCRGVTSDTPTVTHYSSGMSHEEEEAVWRIWSKSRS